MLVVLRTRESSNIGIRGSIFIKTFIPCLTFPRTLIKGSCRFLYMQQHEGNDFDFSNQPMFRPVKYLMQHASASKIVINLVGYAN